MPNAPEDNHRRARTLVTLLRLLLWCTAVSIGFFLYYCIYLDAFSFGYDEMRGFSISTIMVSSLLLVRWLLYAVTGIAFILWFSRAYRNLHRIGVPGMEWKPGWAAGSWFVPFVNLAVPVVIMKEIWYKTQEQTVSEDEYIHTATPVGWWWILFLLGRLIATAGNFAVRDASILAFLAKTVILYILVYIIDTLGLVLAIKMVKRISVFENRLFDQHWKNHFGDNIHDPFSI